MKLNYALIASFVGLFLIGCSAQYSASGGYFRPFLAHQLGVASFVGVPLFCLCWHCYPRLVLQNAYVIYLFVLLLMLAVFFAGKSVMGAKRWLYVFGFSLQPTEFLKITAGLFLARYFVNCNFENIKSFVFLLLPVVCFLPAAFLILKQPSLGTFIVVCFIGLAAYFVMGVPYRYFIVFFCLVAVFAPVLWKWALHDYQKTRIKTFFYTEKSSDDASYNIRQSQIAIGSGGAFGKGFLNGSQTQLHFLPEKHTDFILAVVAEEFGFIGILTTITFYFCFCCSGFFISFRSKDVFQKILTFCISFCFFLHLLINASMICGLLPVVGMPLPLLSYGGTVTACSICAFAFLLKSSNINRNCR